MKRFHIEDEAAMQAFGAKLAQACQQDRKCGLMIYLEGDLGAGKTTLSRGFMRGLGFEGPVKSPTYTLIEPYQAGGRDIYHLDLYRLADPEELEYLGLRDMLQPEDLCLVEWPEKGEGFLAPAQLLVKIEYLPVGRNIVLTAKDAEGKQYLEKI